MTVPIIDGVSTLAMRYDAMILDMWGLIHDGVVPYPGVPECLDRLREHGVRTIFLSNAVNNISELSRCYLIFFLLAFMPLTQ